MNYSGPPLRISAVWYLRRFISLLSSTHWSGRVFSITKTPKKGDDFGVSLLVDIFDSIQEYSRRLKSTSKGPEGVFLSLSRYFLRKRLLHTYPITLKCGSFTVHQLTNEIRLSKSWLRCLISRKLCCRLAPVSVQNTVSIIRNSAKIGTLSASGRLTCLSEKTS